MVTKTRCQQALVLGMNFTHVVLGVFHIRFAKYLNASMTGDMTPKYRDLLLNALLSGARDADPLVRASAVSNLGEVCKTLHYSLGSCVQEVRQLYN